MHARFHYSFHVTDLDQARQFYGETLGFTEGRSAATWVDFDCHSHQLSLHLGTPIATTLTGKVDGVAVPMPHFGVCLTMPAWQALANKLVAAGADFILKPHIRYAGQVGEQGVFFLCDPFGNALEIKGFTDFAGVFAN